MTMTCDLVADLDDVFDGRHAVVGQLADADEAFLAGHDLDEGAEVDRAGDAAGVDLADARPPRVRPSMIAMALAGVLFVGGADEDRAVVLDVDACTWSLR